MSSEIQGYPQFDFEIPDSLTFEFPLEIQEVIHWWPFDTEGYWGGQYHNHSIHDELGECFLHDPDFDCGFMGYNFKEKKVSFHTPEDLVDRYDMMVLWLMLYHRWHYYHSITKVNEDLYLNIKATVREYEDTEDICHAAWGWGRQSMWDGNCEYVAISKWLRLISAVFIAAKVPINERKKQQAKVRQPKILTELKLKGGLDKS